MNGTIGKHALPVTPVPGKSNDLGVAVSRQTLSPVKAPHTSGSAASTPLPQEHGKISFSFNARPFQMHNQVNQPKPQPTATGQASTPAKTNTNHICLRIENGKAMSFEKSPDGMTKVIKDSSARKSTLVPYDSDSDSGDDGLSWDRKASARVALNFSDSQEKENVSDNASHGASSGFSPSSKLVKEKSETVASLHKASSLPGPSMPKVGGFDSKVPQNLTLKLNTLPLKKMSIETLCPSAKNTTTSWFVQAKDPACSPSLGSCSSNNSNHSTNSTTEWGESHGGKHELSARKTDPSWKVSGSSSLLKRKLHLFTRSDSMEEIIPSRTKHASRLKRASSVEPLLTRHPIVSSGDGSTHVDGAGASVKKSQDDNALLSVDNRLGLSSLFNSGLSEKQKRTSVEQEADFSSYSVSDKQPLLQAEEEYSERPHKKKKKKHKKEKKKQKYESLQDSSVTENGHSRHKKKKKKHKRERDHHEWEEKQLIEHSESDGERKRKQHNHHGDTEDNEKDHSARKRKKSESSDSSEYMWQERTKETLLQEQHNHHHKVDGKKRSTNPFVTLRG
jgi:hypothetical protein